MRYSLDKNISMYRSPLPQEEEPLSSAYQMREADLFLQIYPPPLPLWLKPENVPRRYKSIVSIHMPKDASFSRASFVKYFF